LQSACRFASECAEDRVKIEWVNENVVGKKESKMNQQFERRLRRLEQHQERGKRKKPILPEWLLEEWHAQTGLPFDTDEHVRDSLQRMQQREYQRKSERMHPGD
jgi:hypothetical protein